MDHILRMNSFLKGIIEGTIEGRVEMTGRRQGRRKKLPDDLKERRGYWKLVEGAVVLTAWRNRCVRGYGPVVRQTTE